MKKDAKPRVPMSCRLDSDINILLESYCESHNVNKTSVVEESLKKYINEKLEDEKLIEQYHQGKIRFVKNE